MRENVKLNGVNFFYVELLKFMIFTVVASSLIYKFLWKNNSGLVHSVLELIGVLFGVSLFFIVWNKYKDSPLSCRVISFGILASTIIDILHIYYYEPLGIAFGDRNMTLKFWIVGSLIDITMIFVASFDYGDVKVKIKRELYLIITFAFAILLGYEIIGTNSIAYLFLNINFKELDGIRILHEFIIISLAILSLIRYRDKINEGGYISYKYLALALITMIPIELCFTRYKDFESPLVVYGHVLNVLYCYFLYKSIFQSSINYTYEQLNNATERLNEILDSIPIAIQTYDSNLRLDFANREFEKMFCYNRDELIGLDIKEIDKAFMESNEGKVSLEEEFSNYDDSKEIITAYKLKNGRDLKINMKIIKINNGFLLTIKDTGKEQEINNLHIQTKTVLNSMQSPAFICDNKLRILSVNKAFVDLTGLSDKKVSGMEISLLANFLNYTGKKVISTEKIEGTITNIYGVEKKIIFQASDILNIYGKSIGKVIVITDMTDFKDRQEQLLHKEKLALLGQMGAKIVHETRNFLTTIKGCSQLIEAIAKDDKVIQYAKRINCNTDEVNGIISNFLSLSKPKKAMLEEISFRDLLEAIKVTIETSYLFRGISIDFNYKIDDRYILCDESQMKQVILNICKNAAEAMNEMKDAKLILEAGITEENNSVYIKVSDNGIGMDKETLNKIGTAFFTTKQGGTGLGLSVCYDIVRQHGGYIKVNSKKGIGTTFTINLPGLEEEELDQVI